MRRTKIHSLALRVGIAGPAVLVAIWVAAGWLSPEYDPTRHSLSSLAVGNMVWLQTINFCLLGFSVMALAVALHSSIRHG